MENKKSNNQKFKASKYKSSNEIEYKNEINSYRPKAYKFPLSVSIEKYYVKNNKGQMFQIYSKKSKYEDRSILIQTNDD